MPFTKLLPTSIDLAQNFAFTGTVAGAGGGKVLQMEADISSNQLCNYTTPTVMTASITPSATSSNIFYLLVNYYVSCNDSIVIQC